jgi:hypothetical protein
MICRDYNPAKDKDAVYRVLREVGWLEPGKEQPFDLVLECGRTLVAEVEGAAECLVATAPGSMRYLGEEMPFVEVTLVATSRIARRQGLAQRVVAAALAADAAEGALLARVCVFDQGFYNRVGFGPGSYEHTFFFDPATLRVDVRPRVPRRLTAEDVELVHASRLSRRRGHGGVNYPAVQLSEVEMRYWTDKGFGLGYCDGPSGELTHHFWCSAENVEHGPYNISWMAFQSREQFLELMALIKSLGDQIALVRMREPQGVQLQDLLDRPFRQHFITEKARYENRAAAYAFWQVRMLDVPACISRTRLDCADLRFNLRLTDPAEELLKPNSVWRGAAGDYVVTFGGSCEAETGSDVSLPTLTASVNAFTRLWLGVGRATGLAFTDDLKGPAELLEALDSALRLPEPRPGWDF